MVEMKGIVVPILTPMHEDESVNLEALRAEVERLIAAGIHGIFPFGTNGEGYILSEQEKETVLMVCVEQARGRVPVYAGTGCISTRDTIRLSRRAQALGADALSLITPWFASASQEELYTHYKQVAQSVQLPIVLYNIPARTGNALSPATVKRLGQIDNVVGAKDSSGNFDNILQYIEQTREQDFVVFSGNDSLILWTLLAGGVGGIAGCANVCPRNVVAIYERCLAGDMAGARKAQDAIRPLRNCFKYGNPNTIIKAAAAMLGHPVGKCRAPFSHLSGECVEALGKALDTMRAEGALE